MCNMYLGGDNKESNFDGIDLDIDQNPTNDFMSNQMFVYRSIVVYYYIMNSNNNISIYIKYIVGI